MSHARFQERILELAYGELSPREARAVEAHATSCEECGAELARIRATRRVMATLPDVPAPEAGERILLAAAREAARDPRPVRILPGWLWSTSVVAALFLAVGAVSYRILSTRPAPEREGEELLGRTQYAEPAPAPPAPASGEEGAPRAAAPAEAPAAAPAPPHPARPARPAAPAKRRERSLAREEPVSAAPAPAAEASPPERHAYAEAPVRAEARRADDADLTEAAPEETAGFAAPPERAEEPSPRTATAAPRSRSADAPAGKAASAPARAAEAPVRDEAAAGPDRAAAALARYGSLRAAGTLSGEIRTFPGCEGESWRKVERDAQGRTVKYLREGRVGGRRVRVEHLFGADGALAAVRATDVERGAAVDPGALGLTLPRHAGEAGPDAPPRCER